MEFIDLKAQQERIRDKIEQRIKNVLDHGKYIMGPEVAELEERLADYVGVKHCIAVSSGTDGLLIAMMALGIGPGDEVITTPFTFIATGEMIVLLGATPVFVDIDPQTYNIDPEKIEEAITEKTRAILPVSLYGQCADFDAINAIASKHALNVIEDAAQSFGATCKGLKSCSLSTIGVTSFFPSKPLGCYGDGGAIFTDNDDLAKLMKEIRVHGQDRRYHHPVVGINGRMDTIQAAILLEKLEIFPDEVGKRESIGGKYTELLSEVEGIITPYIQPDNTSVYAQYTIQVANRDRVETRLNDENIPTVVHYPMPLHDQAAIKERSKVSRSLLNTETAVQRVMSLPMHPFLDDHSQNMVINKLIEIIHNQVG